MDKRIEEIRDRLRDGLRDDYINPVYEDDIEYLLAFVERNTCESCGHESVQHVFHASIDTDACTVDGCTCGKGW